MPLGSHRVFPDHGTLFRYLDIYDKIFSERYDRDLIKNKSTQPLCAASVPDSIFYINSALVIFRGELKCAQAKATGLTPPLDGKVWFDSFHF